MECDWEVDIAPDAPVIDAAWDGYIDLRDMPSRIVQIGEIVQLPALRDVLIDLNSHASPVWTAKCDVWVPESFDPDELDASPEAASSGLASYIDLIPVDSQSALALEAVVDWCKRLCADLKTRSLCRCRVDAVIRRTYLTSDLEGLGVTIYVSACGPSPEEASKAMSCALETLAGSVMIAGASSQQSSKYNQR